MKRIGLLCMVLTSMMSADNTIMVHNGSDKEVSIVVVNGTLSSKGEFFVDGGNTTLDYPAGIQAGHVRVLTIPAHAAGKIGRPKKVSGPQTVMVLSTRGPQELMQYLENGTLSAQDIHKIDKTTQHIYLGPVTTKGSKLLKDNVMLYTSQSAWKKASGTYTETTQDAVLSPDVALSRG